MKITLTAGSGFGSNMCNPATSTTLVGNGLGEFSEKCALTKTRLQFFSNSRKFGRGNVADKNSSAAALASFSKSVSKTITFKATFKVCESRSQKTEHPTVCSKPPIVDGMYEGLIGTPRFRLKNGNKAVGLNIIKGTRSRYGIVKNSRLLNAVKITKSNG